MKQLVLTIALCLVAGSFAFGQKKAVKSAKADANATPPNFTEARNQIKGALEHEETKELAETWFTAGWIENKEFDTENGNQIMGKGVNEETMYTALFNILSYFEKADELDLLPDSKGKVKPKYRKDMKAILRANHNHLINGGAYYYEKRNFSKAYDFFSQYLTMPDLTMFADEAFIAKEDTNYLKIKFFAGLTASQMENHEKAVVLYEDLKALDYNPKETYKYLAYEYDILKDTVNFIKTLRDGADKFPGDSYFLLNLINQYIYTGQKDEAVDYLNKAIAQNPDDPQLYNVLGTLYEERKEAEKAQEYFDKALSLDPESAETQANIGRIYFNKGVELRAIANEISDQKKYTEALAVSNEKFKQALPYFEKAHQIDPEERGYMDALKSLYYNLDMGKEYDAIEAKMNK